MRRIASLMAVAVLVLPATASAKGMLMFPDFPDTKPVGSMIGFTAMANAPGMQPLVEFTNTTTGETVWTWSSPADLNGLSYGSVRLPATGPWQTQVLVGGVPTVLHGDSIAFEVGIGLGESSERPRAFAHVMDLDTVWLAGGAA
jgi:hypothetical protein